MWKGGFVLKGLQALQGSNKQPTYEESEKVADIQNILQHKEFSDGWKIEKIARILDEETTITLSLVDSTIERIEKAEPTSYLNTVHAQC